MSFLWLKTAYFGDFNKYGKGHSVEHVVELKREKRSIFWSISECSGVEPISTDKKPSQYLQICALGKLKARGFSFYNFV